MKHLLLRLAARVLMLLIASGLLSGALAASEDAGAGLESGALVQVTLSETAQTFSFTPQANADYGVYVLPESSDTAARAELRLGDEVVAQGEGTMRVIRCRLNAGATYTLALTGTGSGRLEVARETLSRCWSMPIELTDGGSYAKLIARAGDVHWYACGRGARRRGDLLGDAGKRLPAAGCGCSTSAEHCWRNRNRCPPARQP